MKTTIIIENHNLETLEKQFNEVYYSTFAKDSVDLSENQINTYRTLAGQCPLLNGDVVYRSRAVMRLYDDTTYYDDALICESIGLTYKFAQAKKPIIKNRITCNLAPNPTKDKSYITFSEIPQESVTIRLTDFQGRILLLDNKELNSNIYAISTSHLPEGIYFVQVSMGKTALFDGKLQVTKE